MSQPSQPQPDLFIDKSAAALDEEARKVKKTKDYTAEVAQVIPSTLATFAADRTKYQDAINTLLPLEKKARLASDVPSTSATAKAILQVCAEAGKWDLLSDQLSYLVKCRAQLIAVIKATVAYTLAIVQDGVIAQAYTPSTTTTTTTTTTTMGEDQSTSNNIKPNLDRATILELLATIIRVADGKLCVEYEHATATVLKANMIRDESSTNPTTLKDSYTLITSIPAEVIGSMSYYEKCTTILNQTGLAILNNDYTQGGILLKKIRLSELNKYTELKYFYYILQAKIHYNANNWLEACRAYYQLFLHVKTSQELFDKNQDDYNNAMVKYNALAPPAKGKPAHVVPELKPVISKEYGKTVLSQIYGENVDQLFQFSTDDANNAEKRQQVWQPWLQRAIIAGVLAPYDYESEQQLQLIATNDQYVTKCGFYATLLKCFISKQIIYWPICKNITASYSSQYQFNNEEVDLLSLLQQDELFVFSNTNSTTTTTMSDDVKDVKVDKKWTLLRQRVIQHDIRILSQCFSQITFAQAVELLGVPIKELELELAGLAQQFGLRLDRRNELINFIQTKEASGINVLSKWADDLTELFNLVENTEQFIQKVRTMNQVQ